jgi:archaellum component FlaC
MKEHHEELLQNVADISHQYNELQELLQTKKKMIVDETTKSIEHVNRYFETYINELRETQHKIILDIERAKQDAQVKRVTECIR